MARPLWPSLVAAAKGPARRRRTHRAQVPRTAYRESFPIEREARRDSSVVDPSEGVADARIPGIDPIGGMRRHEFRKFDPSDGSTRGGTERRERSDGVMTGGRARVTLRRVGARNERTYPVGGVARPRARRGPSLRAADVHAAHARRRSLDPRDRLEPGVAGRPRGDAPSGSRPGVVQHERYRCERVSPSRSQTTARQIASRFRCRRAPMIASTMPSGRHTKRASHGHRSS
jgi:hypothetical protein